MSARVAGVAALLSLAAACGEAAGPATPSGEVVAEGGASNPTVALAPDGLRAYVAWVGTHDGRSDVYLARSDEGAPFGTPVRVNDRPGDAAPHAQAPAQVAVGPKGVVYVVWQNNTMVEGRRFPASDLRFARSTDGGRTFEATIYVNEDAGGPPTSHTFHDMAVAADGTVYVSWIDGRPVEGRELPPHPSSSTPAAAHGYGHHPTDDGGSHIRLARSTDGGRTFGPGRVVDVEACPCCRTSLAVGPAGEVWVAWRKVFEGSVRDVVVARSRDGGESFEAPVRVHRDGWKIDACPHAGPAVAVDGGGRLQVAWFTGAEGRAGAYWAREEGAGFGEPVALTSVGGVPTTQVAMAADEPGTVWLAWEDPEGLDPRLRLSRATEEHPPRPVELGGPVGMLPALSARDGRVALAWLDGESVRVVRRDHATR